LTVAQALVRFLSVQYTERDGVRRRLIDATWGIFGHGNVAGLGLGFRPGGGRGFRAGRPRGLLRRTATGERFGLRRRGRGTTQLGRDGLRGESSGRTG
ncbi:hypothetical protein R5A26_47750, partial [Streptomyces prunicolor]|nr:hypothetical protein [Streptomyces prunicolor]